MLSSIGMQRALPGGCYAAARDGCRDKTEELRRLSPRVGLQRQEDRTRCLTNSRSNSHHPGHTIREGCIEALGLTAGEAAAHLQIEEVAPSALCACEAPITADLAIRFEQAFGSATNPLLRLQNTYDLAQVQKSVRDIEKVERRGTSCLAFTTHQRHLAI